MPRRREALTRDREKEITVSGGRSMVRTTIIIPSSLKRNVEALARIRKLSQGEIIERALRAYLESEGLNPDRIPVLTVSY